MAIYIAIFLFFIWLCVVSYMLYKTRRHYFNLISKTRKERIDEMLDELLKNDKKFSQDIGIINTQLKGVIEHSKIPLQKVGLVRFNPFERVGGEQSFVLSLLNDHNSGLVINFIYTREGLRTYIKKVKAGKGEKYELSDEELEAIKKSY